MPGNLILYTLLFYSDCLLRNTSTGFPCRALLVCQKAMKDILMETIASMSLPCSAGKQLTLQETTRKPKYAATNTASPLPYSALGVRINTSCRDVFLLCQLVSRDESKTRREKPYVLFLLFSLFKSPASRAHGVCNFRCCSGVI